MKIVILAGGLGTRLSEETEIRPKPMVEIGGRPILWHIMKHYAHHGLKEFFIALGYRGEVIKRFFMDFPLLDGSMSIDFASGHIDRQDKSEDWVVHLKDTGQETNTGGRLKRLEPFLREGTFMLTYGDGVCDIDFDELLKFHRSHGHIATVSAVRPPARFGGLIFDGDMVSDFTEKAQLGEGWINGGFLVCEPGIFRYLDGDDSSLEVDALERLAADRQLAAFRHEGFWQCMDTLRDKRLLESLWSENRAPWKVWE
jgi:glucose-1-phosphate cytidylyltransferase